MFSRFRNNSRRQNNPAKLLLNLFSFSLICAGLWFITINIVPYIKFVTYFSKQVIGFPDSVISGFMLFVFGVSFWAILQFLQLFPLLLFSNENFMRQIINRSDTRKKVSVKDNDEAMLRRIKVAYNALPTSYISNLEKWCVVSYLLDFYINCTTNPPIKGGFEVLGDMLLYGKFELLDWANILLNLQTVFAVEFVVLMLIWSAGLIRSFNDNV